MYLMGKRINIMKIRNKLAIFIVAALMASSAIVVSANAIAEKVINDVFQDAAVKATLHFDDLGNDHMAIASTEYAKSGRVFVALDVTLFPLRNHF